MKSLLMALLALGLVAAPGAEELGVRGVTRDFYSGWEGALMMRGGDCKLVVVPGVGGRVMEWSLNSENIIYQNRSAFGRTLSNSPAGFSPGGAQCDLGPELRGIVPHPNLWNGQWFGHVPRDHVIHVASPADMTVGIQLEKEFTMDPDNGELGLVQRMRNVITSETSFCLWNRSLCKGGGFALLPLNKKSRFKAQWSIRRGEAGHYSYDGTNPSDRRARVLDDVLVVNARGLAEAPNLKVGTDTADGWIGYVVGKLLFVKYFPVTPNGDYSDGGNTVEFYCDARVAEIEPLSPEIRLKSGEDYLFPEKWTLTQLDKEVLNAEQARAVVKKIGRSPFK